jgi:hypothetical protein
MGGGCCCCGGKTVDDVVRVREWLYMLPGSIFLPGEQWPEASSSLGSGETGKRLSGGRKQELFEWSCAVSGEQVRGSNLRGTVPNWPMPLAASRRRRQEKRITRYEPYPRAARKDTRSWVKGCGAQDGRYDIIWPKRRSRKKKVGGRVRYLM